MKLASSSGVARTGSYTVPVPGAPNGVDPEVDGISIVLPARNEVANIAKAVESSLAVARRLTVRHEVIVVDDGSRDGTGAVVEGLARQHYPRVRLVTHPVNQGYGAALRTGFEHARFGLVFFTDSDNQFDVGEIRSLLPLMADHDLVTGFRVNRNDPPIRAVFSWLYNRLVEVLFGVRVRDVNCAFKLMNRELIDGITIECHNFFVNTELLAKARRQHFRIA
jgi:glycosyltransferase involved in cell wall biosynthesis